jgi:hypothetical protein
MSTVKIDLSERIRNVYFDTSIFNHLLDDPEKNQLLGLIKGKHLIVIPSIVNLCEMLLTCSSERKNKLIDLYHEIRNEFFPLKPFVWVLKECIDAVEAGREDFEINYPIEISVETENICRDLKRQEGVEIEPYIQRARDFIQEVAKKEKLADEIQYFAFITSEKGEQILLDLFDKICPALGIDPRLNIDSKLSIIQSPFMPWKYYLEAISYLFYRRAFPDTNYGKRSNLGYSDLEQCVYMFWAGKFIIEDDNFLDFLKRLKEIRNYETEIMNYSDFKSFLIKKSTTNIE